MSFIKISQHNRHILLSLARQAIEHYLNNLAPPEIDLSKNDDEITCNAACFVTIVNANGHLRGCIGTLESHLPLITNVAAYAVSASHDSRFPALTKEALTTCVIDISVLTPRDLIPAETESDLLAAMTPNKDGIVIDDGHHRATFLPKVWESLPDKKEFLRHLKLKAGLHSSRWPKGMKCYRYHTINFSEASR